jgi:hypothetical protein
MMGLNDYYKQLMSYRDMIDLKIAQGKLDTDRARDLINKLNEWFEHAKFLSKIDGKKEK